MTRTARLAPVIVVLALALPGSAFAATINVTTTEDSLNTETCSLREAVSAADLNNAGASGCTDGSSSSSEPDTIVLGPGTYTLTLGPPGDSFNNSGDIDIFNDNDLTIDGAGAGATTINGAGTDRIFDIGFLNNVEIRDLTLTNGHAPDGGNGSAGADNPGTGQPSVGGPGSTGSDGGAIAAEGTQLTLTSVVISNSSAGDGGSGGNGRSPGSASAGQNAPDSLGGNGGNGGRGGAIYMDDGAAVTAVDSRFRGNRAGNGGGGGDGGQTHPGADGGTFGRDGGASVGGDGGPGGAGGAVYADSDLIDLTRVSIDNNDAGNGGNGGFASESGSGGFGTYVGGTGGRAAGGNGGLGGASALTTLGALLTITDSRFSANESGRGGDGAAGGIGGGPGPGALGGDVPGGNGGSGGDVASLTSLNEAVITRTTIDGNSTGDGGDGGDAGQTSTGSAVPGAGGFGGSTGLGKGTGGTLTLTNSTLSGNSTGNGGAAGAGGTGGDAGYDAGLDLKGGAQATLTHVTIASNVTGVGGPGNVPGAGGGTGGIRTNTGATVTLRNSLVASNSPSQCSGGGTLVDGGRNLAFPPGSTCPAATTANPLLGPLANNGGDAPTRALLAGSPAIDAVPAAGSNCEDRDQREVLRPRGSACDIGAFERAAPSATTGAASGVSATAASLAGVVAANTRPTTYRFAYGKTTGYGGLTPPVSAGSGTAAVAAAASLAGLEPGTTYHYRVVASNGDGTTPGADSTFTTAALPPVAFAGLSILTKNVRADSKGRVSVNLRCPAAAVGNCKGKITLKAKIKRNPVTLASARFSIAPGKSKRVRLKLSRKRRGQLRRAKKLKATLSVSAVDARGGKSKVKSGKLTLKAPKRKR